jgi:predicted molibdopterin-dependent oxidoreductase YjgC
MFKEIELLEHLVAHIAAQRKIQKLPDPLSQWIAQKAEFLNANYPKSVPKNEFIALLNGLLQDGPCAIVFGPQIAQFHQGHKLIALVAALTYLLDAKLFLLSHSPNEHGAVDMGCVPDALAGNIPIANHEGLKYVERLWNEPLSSRRGLTLMEMIEAADSGQLKALYIMGDNPAFNLPDTPKTTRALQNLELLIVQDVFHTETVALAHIALPATSWGQTDGTYINLERRIQRVRKWVDGARLEDWRIMNELLCEMGYDADYREASQVFDEIATVSPMHKGLSYQDLEPDGCLFPYRGDPVKSERNKPIEINMKGAMTFEGSIYLSVEDSPYHAGVLSRYCPSLRKLSPSPSLKLSPSLFQELKLFEGQRVIATSALGSLEVEAEQDPFLPPDIAMLTNHFEQAGAYRLIGYTLDPVTKIPGVRGWKITIIPKTF